STLEFEAMDPTGDVVKDGLTASGVEEAQRKIREMGYFVTKLRKIDPSKESGSWWQRLWGKGATSRFACEVMDSSGAEEKGTIDAVSDKEAEQKLRQQGYFVTKLRQIR